MKSKRLSNFELLRIIAMYLIVLHHSVVHGVCDVTKNFNMINDHPLNGSIAYTLGSGGEVGVYIFVLITGYFMINSHISLAKLVKLWLPIFFWSLSLYVIFNYRSISILGLFKTILPITFGQYWFMTTYVFMYLLIPFLNKGVDYINSKTRLWYFLILGCLLIISGCPILGMGTVTSRLADFCVVYMIGALIRKSNLLQKEKYIKYANIAMVVLCSLDILSIALLISVGTYIHKIVLLKLAQNIVISPWTMIGILIAIAVFMVLGSHDIRYNKLINKISAVTFGIYLISDNQYLNIWLWQKIFHMNQMITQAPLFMLLYVILVSIIVFCLTGIIESIRKFLFRRFENKVVKEIPRKV